MLPSATELLPVTVLLLPIVAVPFMTILPLIVTALLKVADPPTVVVPVRFVAPLIVVVCVLPPMTVFP